MILPAVLGVMSRVAQFGINKLAIDEQNRYNSPVAQLGRYKRAGLNPALLYQRVEPGLQTQANRYSDSTLSKDLVEGYNADTNRFNAETQREVAKADIKLKKQQAKALRMANNNAETLQKYIDSNPDDYFIPQAKKFLADYKKVLADTRNVKSDTDLKEQQLEINRINQDLYETKFWQDMEKGQEEIDNIKADTDHKNAQTNLTNLDILNYEARFLAKQKPWFLPLLEDIADKLNITVDKAVSTISSVVDKTNNQIAKARHGIDFNDAKCMELTDKKLPFHKDSQIYERENFNKVRSGDGYIYVPDVSDYYILEYHGDVPYFRKLSGTEINSLK